MAARAGKRPTISEVAQRAGVSTGTVSRYLNGGRWVSPESSRAVARAIRETGYVASSTARSLRTGRTGTVAFVIDESPARFFEDPNFEALVEKVGEALAARDRTLVLLLAGDSSGADRAEAFLRTSSVDGAVTASAQPEHRLVERILDAGIPLVNIGAPAGIDDRVSYVAADDSAGGRAMAEHLLARGARHLAVIAGPAHTPGGLLRPQSFGAAIEEAGRDAELVAVRHGDYSRESGRRLAAELLAEHPEIDGIFAGNDRMARGVIAAVRESGRTVPGDVLVGGFDDSPADPADELALTTIRQDFDRIAAELVDVLDKQAAAGVRTAAVVPVELVARASTDRGGEVSPA
ncbi:LacI family DNA-binding transcriptional regulator [Brachybacterium sp. DNPG3]